MTNRIFKKGQEVFEVYSNRNDADTKTIWSFRNKKFKESHYREDSEQTLITFSDSSDYAYTSATYVFGTEKEAQKATNDLNGKEFYDSDYEDLITCPMCGETNEDSWEYGESDTEYECGNCDEVLDLTVHVTVQYSTELKAESGE